MEVVLRLSGDREHLQHVLRGERSQVLTHPGLVQTANIELSPSPPVPATDVNLKIYLTGQQLLLAVVCSISKRSRIFSSSTVQYISGPLI